MENYLKYEWYGKNEDLYRAYEERKNSDVATKVVMKGTYKGRHFMIGASRLGFPVAYVEVKEKDSYIMCEPEECREDALHSVNGCSNYYGRAYWDPEDPRMYIGWRYGEADDYLGHRNPEQRDRKQDTGHKWTLAEILMQISEAIMEIGYEGYIDRNFRYAPA